MRLEEIGHRMTQITDILTSASGKLNQIGDLNLALGEKLDRLAGAVAKLASEQLGANRRFDDRFANLLSAEERNQERFDRLIQALEKRG